MVGLATLVNADAKRERRLIKLKNRADVKNLLRRTKEDEIHLCASCIKLNAESIMRNPSSKDITKDSLDRIKLYIKDLEYILDKKGK